MSFVTFQWGLARRHPRAGRLRWRRQDRDRGLPPVQWDVVRPAVHDGLSNVGDNPVRLAGRYPGAGRRDGQCHRQSEACGTTGEPGALQRFRRRPQGGPHRVSPIDRHVVHPEVGRELHHVYVDPVRAAWGRSRAGRLRRRRQGRHRHLPQRHVVHPEVQRLDILGPAVWPVRRHPGAWRLRWRRQDRHRRLSPGTARGTS